MPCVVGCCRGPCHHGFVVHQRFKPRADAMHCSKVSCRSSEETGEQSRTDVVGAAESAERRAGANGNPNQHPRTGLSAGNGWYWCWRAYVKLQSLIVRTRGGNRMRESRTYGSVRGARGNSRPYRDLSVVSGLAHEDFRCSCAKSAALGGTADLPPHGTGTVPCL